MSNIAANRHIIVYLLAAVTMLVATAGMSACAPSGRAVGDAAQSSSLAHDGIDRSDVRISFISAREQRNDDEDERVINYLQQQSFELRYSSSVDVTNGQEAALKSAILDKATLVMLRCGSSHTPQGCVFDARIVAALTSVRNAGIPVVLVTDSQQSTNLDTKLYAAQFVLSSTSSSSRRGTQHPAQQSISLEEASFIVMNNGNHAKTILVSW